VAARNEACLQATVEANRAALLVRSRLVPGLSRFFFWLWFEVAGSLLPRVLRKALDAVAGRGKLRGPQRVIWISVADVLVEGVFVCAHEEDTSLLTFKAAGDVTEIRWQIFWGRPEEPGAVTLIFQ